MSRSAPEIQGEWLTQLLPSGSAWPNSDSNLAALLMARAIPAAQLEEEIEALKAEIRPATSLLLLKDYHTVLGADPCGADAGNLTTAQLQQLLDRRWTQRGGATIAYFEGLGALYGVSVQIEELEPSICGQAVCGVDVCTDLAAQYTVVVTLSQAGSGLECVLRREIPADVTVVFKYPENG